MEHVRLFSLIRDGSLPGDLKSSTAVRSAPKSVRMSTLFINLTSSNQNFVSQVIVFYQDA
jgi:hypothetical protein